MDIEDGEIPSPGSASRENAAADKERGTNAAQRPEPSSFSGSRQSRWASLDDEEEPIERKQKKRKRAVEGETSHHGEDSARRRGPEPRGLRVEDRRDARSATPEVIRTQMDGSPSPTVSPRPQAPPQPRAPRLELNTFQGPTLTSCRSVDLFEKLNRIEEGAYGIVYRARDRQTGEVVALKKLKLDQEKNGFPVTSLREIQTLLLSKHPNIVNVKEIVVGESLTRCSFGAWHDFGHVSVDTQKTCSILRSVFIVMEFLEHDLKALMEVMRSRSTTFLQSEVKTVMVQLLSAVRHLHDNWIIHRDLKTSNLLMNNRGMIKVADFGLARRFGSPMAPMTQLVVTLWYRAPELLLGTKEYTTAIDMWSVGCIFAELVNNEPLMQGRNELDQLSKVCWRLTRSCRDVEAENHGFAQMFQLLGTPNDSIWPGFSKLPNAQTFSFANQPWVDWVAPGSC